MKKNLCVALAAMTMGMTSCATQKDLNLNGEWKVINIKGMDVPETMQEAVLAFDESSHSYHGVTGVNIINGSYSLNDQELTLGEGAMTRMMGDPVSMEVETKYVQAVASVKSATMEEDKLLLQDAEGTVLMTLVKH